MSYIVLHFSLKNHRDASKNCSILYRFSYFSLLLLLLRYLSIYISITFYWRNSISKTFKVLGRWVLNIILSLFDFCKNLVKKTHQYLQYIYLIFFKEINNRKFLISRCYSTLPCGDDGQVDYYLLSRVRNFRKEWVHIRFQVVHFRFRLHRNRIRNQILREDGLRKFHRLHGIVLVVVNVGEGVGDWHRRMILS